MLTRLLTVLLLGTLASLTLADDTEVYLGTGAIGSEVRPNVTFIIDTSGSMTSKVTLTSGAYDPTQTYSGNCRDDRIYWSTGKAPSCGTDQWVERDVFVCQDAQAALTTGSGYYVGKLARYRARKKGDEWDELKEDVTDQLVECAADFGKHGDGGTNKYPADEKKGGPFTAAAGNAIKWNSVGDNYTVYSGNYLNWKSSGGGSIQKTRLEVVQDVFTSLIDSTSNINASLVRFDNRSGSYNKGGYFLTPMLELNDANRPLFKSEVNSLTADGYTPLAETLYEVARFYRGENVKFGNSTQPGVNDPGVLVGGAGNTYETPVEYQCQKNFVVLLTDGDPTNDTNADTDINALPGFGNLAGSCGGSDNCLDELAHYLHGRDQLEDLDGVQNVSTYTIGFATDQKLLSDAARKGGGRYFTADDTAGLNDAFASIVTEILSVNTTFVAPSIPVNAFNRLTHRNELYFALFRPGEAPRWNGNIKKYALSGNTIVDASGTPAVDANTGFFKTLSTSYWTPPSDAPDGDKVHLGGAASQLPVTRTLYTYAGTEAPANVALSQADNHFHEDNALLTKDLLGVDTETDDYRTSLLQWARGVDIFDDNEDGSVVDARRYMGDPLHSTPVLINYGGTEADPDVTLFAATNEGFLHAIDVTDGSETFAFMPKELLPNLRKLYENSKATAHPYGLDGPITAWVHDVNNNGRILNGGGVETGEHAYLYVGMRRGGDNYYALDVTNRSQPVLKWIIQGGTGEFAELGQSWSRPVVARVKLNGAVRTVLIFGGGYDTLKDDTASRVQDGQGRAIFMVDAETGKRVWWASSAVGANLSLPAMQYSIPAAVTPVDVNNDGLMDVLFATDTGGQVWRVDFNATNTGADSLATGGVIADLGGANATDNRRFYYKPDVALVKRGGSYAFSISIGSGWRAHPLNTATQDRFYVVFDSHVMSAPASYTAITPAQLYNASTDLSLTGLDTASGWYINLPNTGEKVLAEARTVDGITLFTTFSPTAANPGACSPGQGVARLYAVNTLTGAPVFNLNGVGPGDELTVDDRSKDLSRDGLPPDPTLLFPPDGSDPVVVVGTELVEDIKVSVPTTRTSWRMQ